MVRCRFCMTVEFDPLTLIGCCRVAMVTECSPSHFKCRSGRCVLASKRCDGHLDCDDHSDEDNCGGTDGRVYVGGVCSLKPFVTLLLSLPQAALSALCGSVPAARSASSPP